VACSLRARGADYPTIAATLSAINANRCSPPLEHDEIAKIAFNVCGRYAPGTAAPHVNGEVHAELDTYALAVYGAEWRGKAGTTDRDVLLALIGYARLYGVPIPTGVRLSVSYRDLAMEAGIGSLDTLLMLGGSATVKDLATAMHEPRPAATGLCATTYRRRDCGLRRYNRHDNAFRWLAAEP
jgi:hypothetical protein